MAENNIPQMVNFDESQTIPGSITPKERYQADLNKISKSDEIKNSETDQKPIKLPSPELPSFGIPLQSPVTKITGTFDTPPAVNLPKYDGVATDPIKDAIDLKEKTDIIRKERIKEEISENLGPVLAATPYIGDSKENNDAQNQIRSDSEEYEKRLRDDIPVTAVEVPSEIKPVSDLITKIQPEADIKIEEEVLVETVEVTDKTTSYIDKSPPEEMGVLVEDSRSNIIIPDTPKPQPVAHITDEVNPNSLPQVDEIDEHGPSNIEIPDTLTEDAVKDNPEGVYVQSMDAETALKTQEEEETKANKEILSRSKMYTDAECITLNDFTTTHFKILEAVNPEEEEFNKKGDINLSKRNIIKVSETPDYELRSTAFDKEPLDGARRTQVVALQSGYTCMCKAMGSRELRTFGRREGTENTYAYEMAIANAIYSKLTEFSIGPMKFQEFINNTAYPDLATLIFGVYHATFPSKSLFTFDCNYCNENISVYIDSSTLACIPPGNTMTQQMITDSLSGRYTPQKLQKMSNRWTASDVYIDKKRRFFRVRVPSIAEFLNNAYYNKKEQFISENHIDMFYAGYIRGVGILDTKKFIKEGIPDYYLDERVDAIDRAIANINPDEKRQFDRQVINYITKYSVAYQIPRVRCSHCGRIINQRDINVRSLFFETKAQKGI
jgi:hypothetical protein